MPPRPKPKNARKTLPKRKTPAKGKAPAKAKKRAAASKKSADAKQARRRSPILTIAVFLFWGSLIIAAGLGYIAADLPSDRALSLPAREARLKLIDIHGQTIAERGMRYAGDADLADLPPHVPLAFIAAEDSRFYDHSGVDLWGLTRAMVANLISGRVVQGGSTITQQLAKNLFLTPDRTVKRKLQEVMLASWLEGRLTKDEILALYLNRVYFGAGTYGIEAASRRYFGKPPAYLGLSEAAILAGLLKAPSRYAPSSNRDGAIERANVVLKRMVSEGFITENERRRTDFETVTVLPAPSMRASYFIDWILSRLPAYIGGTPDDITVETTLDKRLQAAAEEAVAAILAEQGGEKRAGQAALVALAPDGSVRAMVGGRDYAKSQFNRAVQARRQPGSAFKPFVFLAALEAGYSPRSKILDAPITIGTWAPRNFKNRYKGEVSLTDALAQSLNGATVRLSERVGRRRVIRVAERLGLRADLTPVASLPLGTAEVSPLHLAAAYVPFANGGRAVMVNPVMGIRSRDGGDLYVREQTSLGQAIDPAHHRAIDAMLKAVVGWGTGKAAKIDGLSIGGKTGTSQDSRDAWFVGYTADLTVCVWVGNDNNTPMDDVTGGTLPARIWRRFMTAALAAPPPETGTEPLTVRSLLLDLRRQP